MPVQAQGSADGPGQQKGLPCARCNVCCDCPNTNWLPMTRASLRRAGRTCHTRHAHTRLAAADALNTLLP